MKVVFAADHAGYALKNDLVLFVRELGCDVDDLGAHDHIESDDYPSIVARAARAVSEDPHEVKAIIVGGSGQGEAIVANRFPNVRAVVYYGEGGEQIDIDGNSIPIVESTRIHNDANILSIGARFLEKKEAEEAVRRWLGTPFSGDERHQRRIHDIEKYS